jgi:hypothetical protein
MIRRVRDDLPSGTVTFLITDVEGSNGLLHELGAEAYAEAWHSIGASSAKRVTPKVESRFHEPTSRRSDCSSPIHPHHRRRRSIDERALGALRGLHQLAALDGHLVHGSNYYVSFTRAVRTR